MYKIHEWLDEKIATHLNGTAMIDVGAYHGDFTERLLSTKNITKSHLFEPNTEHYNYLENKFADNKNISIYPYALGNEMGIKNFNCSQDDATGSLLQYHDKYHHENSGKTVRSFSVDVTTLDDVYAKYFPNDRIGLIKIDTQGFDLEVLKGAEKLIKEQKPWLVIELNFLPFYASQAPINSIFNWLVNAGYSLGGFFNDHYSKDKWLAFADGIFIPENTINTVIEPFTTKAFSEDLLEQNKYLENVCEERLALINDLHTEAVNRLNIINNLNKQSDKQKKTEKKWYQF
ncbi:MAG: FkbM family methyltransferase [Gammaproteobacteria bacterium]|nr:FkbM family methyltransferase [Gammaproteobacteria bacterium]